MKKTKKSSPEKDENRDCCSNMIGEPWKERIGRSNTDSGNDFGFCLFKLYISVGSYIKLRSKYLLWMMERYYSPTEYFFII